MTDWQKSENSIHYNKDWDDIQESLLQLWIESENSIHYNKDWDRSSSIPVCLSGESENSIHYNKDWDSRLLSHNMNIGLVREQHPLQQGLRPCLTSFSVLNGWTVREQHPLQQGLRRTKLCSAKWGFLSVSENSIHYNKDWDRNSFIKC